ncbi:Uncharacterised protein [Bordetella pertussis]|nr:Uncharacterised protein [Bordetella pertussis]CFM03229.1 Uncharacterised protein [Bordetella pertussis]CFM48791.1 Uncharacterised protein [Bordetella pertussis]CFN53361.1 Uncharacterised protein [Bordetella pertussis]CFN60335.1 Uncharacterised protein [Bordetella pertussis]
MGRRNTDAPSWPHQLKLSPSTRRPPVARLTSAATPPPARMSPMPDAPRRPGAVSGASALPTRRISAAATPSG